VRLSVVVRSKDEAPRLRLTLASLERQSAPCEVVVVDDGSSDDTPAVIADAAGRMQLRSVRHGTARGRSAAANSGARAAGGETLLFLDGDTLAAPDLVERHMALRRACRDAIGRGRALHLRCTRFLHDPESGAPRLGEEARLSRLKPVELARLLVTRRQIAEDFGSIQARAEEGIYPGAGPRRLQALEMQALRERPGCSVLWAAACGSNLSVPRGPFLDSGGFDEQIDMNEHRELALRLCGRGLRLVPLEAARTYHMTHRSGWRDPLADGAWERAFCEAHPAPAVALLAVFWASLAPNCPLPRNLRIGSLPELEEAARGARSADYAAARELLGLQPLPAAFASHAAGASGPT